MATTGIGKTLAILSIVTSLVLLPGKDAVAVTWGEPDTDHPYVGWAIVPISETEANICSGALFSSRVFVTAAHCVDGLFGGIVYVGFGDSFPAPSQAGVPVKHSNYQAIQVGPDVAVIILLAGILQAPPYAQLPTAGVLTEQSTRRGKLEDRVFETVGYGFQGVSAYQGEGVLAEQVFGNRQVGELSLLNTAGANSFGGLYAWFSSNDGEQTSGGACEGDSGGPVLLGESDQVVAVNSFGINANCAGTAIASRLDVDSVISFINLWVGLFP